ncbi:glutaredoxin family protein [Methylophilus glucosoxydans]|uniref:Glutaredoxin family protein n=1 Tax=Methylophilus glucosoxydans TaxID=752553 RepID=A0ABW3GHT7_9PROT|nr:MULTISPECIES: glutaredoxin family protein [unclassified Methylophilus]MBF5039642.1 glutaredoxin family protein [Methylophilus sp. 13]MDT7848986.1 glutaredoxin family protein [Methylophilus sp. VKM B-3414]
MQKPLILFGTLGCHLCEDAERILQALKLPYQYVDIIEDEKLLERYQISIPVLLENSSDQENILAWPFNSEQVSQWLLSHRTK